MRKRIYLVVLMALAAMGIVLSSCEKSSGKCNCLTTIGMDSWSEAYDETTTNYYKTMYGTKTCSGIAKGMENQYKAEGSLAKVKCEAY